MKTVTALLLVLLVTTLLPSAPAQAQSVPGCIEASTDCAEAAEAVVKAFGWIKSCKQLRNCRQNCRGVKKDCKDECREEEGRGKDYRKCRRECREAKRQCVRTCRDMYLTSECREARRKIIGAIKKSNECVNGVSTACTREEREEEEDVSGPPER